MKKVVRFVSHGPLHICEVGINTILWLFLRFQVWNVFHTRFSRYYKNETVKIALKLRPFVLIELGAGLAEISGRILRAQDGQCRVIATDLDKKVLIGARIKNWRVSKKRLETHQLDFLSKQILLNFLAPFKTELVIVAVGAVTPDTLALLLSYLKEAQSEISLIIDLRSEYAIMNNLCSWLPSTKDIFQLEHVIHESRDSERSICVITLK